MEVGSARERHEGGRVFGQAPMSKDREAPAIRPFDGTDKEMERWQGKCDA